MKQNLVQRLALPILGASLLSSCVSASYYNSRNYNPAPMPIQRSPPIIAAPAPAQPTQQIQQSNQECQTYEHPSKVLVNVDDPRFSSLKPHYFWACSYSDRYGKNDARGINFNDERNIFHRGEKCIILAAVPESLWGSYVNLIASAPNGDTIMEKKELITREESNSNCIFDVSYLLDNKGAGIYKVAWGFDGKLACLHYLRFQE